MIMINNVDKRAKEQTVKIPRKNTQIYLVLFYCFGFAALVMLRCVFSGDDRNITQVFIAGERIV